MRPVFHSRCINEPFEDPGVYISFLFEGRAILFDAGNVQSLSAKDILKIDYVFVSHTHMDHFSGFDTLLRLLHGRDKRLNIFGPQGFLKNIEGKLAAYTWNLVENSDFPFEITATEVGPQFLTTQTYSCRTGFKASGPPKISRFDGCLVTEPTFTISTAVLDHKIPCLAFSMKEQFHINIIKNRLNEFGMEVGPWLRDLKQAIYQQQNPDSVFQVKIGLSETKDYRLGDLTEMITEITEGQRITYITDAVWHNENVGKILRLAQDSDQLFIESAFLEKDRAIAEQKYHLTAHQAGILAGRANVKHYTLFHFSPRYIGSESLFYEEAKEAFQSIRRGSDQVFDLMDTDGEPTN